MGQRVSATDVSVAMVDAFRLDRLTALYDSTLPYLQVILRVVMAGKVTAGRDPDSVRACQSYSL